MSVSYRHLSSSAWYAPLYYECDNTKRNNSKQLDVHTQHSESKKLYHYKPPRNPNSYKDFICADKKIRLLNGSRSSLFNDIDTKLNGFLSQTNGR